MSYLLQIMGVDEETADCIIDAALHSKSRFVGIRTADLAILRAAAEGIFDVRISELDERVRFAAEHKLFAYAPAQYLELQSLKRNRLQEQRNQLSKIFSEHGDSIYVLIIRSVTSIEKTDNKLGTRF